MSQIAHPAVQSQLRAHWVGVLSALLALLAAIAVSLVLTLDDGGSGTTASVAKGQAAVRSDGGLEESAVAASVGSQPSAGPDESRVAAAIGSSTGVPTGGPDETVTAAWIADR
jgi:hypothetical protein